MKLLFGPGVFTLAQHRLGRSLFCAGALSDHRGAQLSSPTTASTTTSWRIWRNSPNRSNAALRCSRIRRRAIALPAISRKPSRDGVLAPAFTDYQFRSALAAPRNKAIAANRDAKDYFDQGICGPWRKDYEESSWRIAACSRHRACANTATRQVYFPQWRVPFAGRCAAFSTSKAQKPNRKNGTRVARTARSTSTTTCQWPGAANADITDAPFDRKPGDAPALTEDEIKDVVAFLKTLTDGYKPEAK